MNLLHRLIASLVLIQYGHCARLPARKVGSAGPSTAAQPLRNGPAEKSRHIDYGSISTISELVDHRPHKKKKAAMGKYMEAFAKHRDVRAIDLHQSNKGKLAQDLYNLRDLQRPSLWQKRMTLTQQQLLNEAGVDDQIASGILGYNFAHRRRKYVKRRMANKREANLLPSKPGYYAQNREEMGRVRREKARFIRDLDKVVKECPAKRHTAIEIAKLAKVLQPSYPQESIYKAGLRAFLQKNKYSREDIDMAQGTRSLQLEKKRVRGRQMKQLAERQKQTAGVGLHIAASESSLGGTQVDSLEPGAWWDDGYFDDQ